MKISFLMFCVILLLLMANGLSAAEHPLGFSARTVSGEKFQLTPAATESVEPQLTVVSFLGTECPMARIYGPRLSQMAEDFRTKSVRFVAIDSNRQDSFGDLQQFVKDFGIGFPVIHDPRSEIANLFEATRTPEVFLLNSKLEVLYHGRIDDQYEPGINRSAPKRQDLRIAIAEALAGKPVTVPQTTALGCFIGKVSKTDATPIVQNNITYTRHVVPVLQKHCVECHREGEIGPFAMDSYGSVAGWAETMLETIDNGRMPPWHADPTHGDFMNARHMPAQDRQVIRDWIAGGLKEGDASDLPEPIQWTNDWQLEREPDQVVVMRDRPFSVPAEGVVEYQYFVADPGFEEDKWIRGAQVVPGNRSVVHHAIVFVRPPDGARMRGVGWLGAYVPGQRLVPLRPGRARRVPAGSKLVFQMHYTPNGRVQEDLTQVGLLFAKEEDVTDEVLTVIGINQEFEIPPGASRHPVHAQVYGLPARGELLAATPHMHYRGKSFQLFASKDDSQVMLNVPNYDFNWQHTYVLQEPVPLQNLTTLRFEAVFDNSSGNPFNPNPAEWVTWGDQTWEEMAVAFFEVSEPRDQRSLTNPPKKTELAEAAAAHQQAQAQKIDAYVQRALAALDTDQDGIITEDETAIIVRRFGNFDRFDKNGDGIISELELRKSAEEIYK